MSVKHLRPSDTPGLTVWRIDCRPDGYQGKRERLEFEGTESEALEWERKIMRRSLPTTITQPRSIGAIYQVWIIWYRANRAATTAKDVEEVWRNRLSGSFGKLPVKALNRGLIEQYKMTRLQTGVKHRTISKELNYFSGMIKWAVENEICDPLTFQIAGFSRKFTAPPKPRPLTPEQVTLIYNEIENKFKLAFLLMADCGLRLTEAMTLQRDNIEFGHGVLFIIGKGNKERIVPICTDRLLAELKKVEGVTGFLSINPKTGKPYVTIRSALIRAAKRAGIDKRLYHHLLRHTFATNLTAAHCDQPALQAMLGHSSAQTTGMYQHLAGEYLRGEGSKLNDMVKKEPLTSR